MQQWAPKRKFVGIALVHHDSVETQPSQIADKLVEHWKPVFSARPVIEELLEDGVDDGDHGGRAQGDAHHLLG